MKKIVFVLSLIFAVPVLFSGCTQATTAAMADASLQTMETAERIATGTVEALHSFTVTAPFGGIVQEYDIRRGDEVKKGDELFSLDTAKVYAPCGGTAGSVRALSGDSAVTVQSRYGALCYIDPDRNLVVNASTAGAHAKTENKVIQIGETLYVKNNSNSRIKGGGRVISVMQNSFRLELEEGSFESGDAVSLFREEDLSSDSKVGTGKIARIDPLPVVAQGSVLKVHVEEGQKVVKGDMLFEMVSGDITGMGLDGSKVLAGRDGVLGDILVTAGQSVQKDQPLAKLYDSSEMIVVAGVDEMDIEDLKVGDAVTIVFDSIQGKSYEGRVEAISGLGLKKQNASYFDIRVSFVPDSKVKLGMSATVRLDG